MKTTQTVLLVDDDPNAIRLMEILLKYEDYGTLATQRGEDALTLAVEHQPDIILLDIMMPEMNGFEVAKKLKSDPRTRGIPIIMLTALDDRDARLRALVAGAEEFLTKPVDRAELSIRVKNLIRLKEYADFFAEHNYRLEEQVTVRAMQLTESHRETIYVMTSAAEHKDEDTGLHVARISHYCRALAVQMGLSAEFADCIFYASPMHDIGKIGVPDDILIKPGNLTPEEREIMKKHPELGAEILKKAHSAYMIMGAEIALNHHERWDGGGYPNGKRGEDIPFAARLMNIADQYDALRAKRPYKPALDHETVMKILMEGDGRTMPDHFDPKVLVAFKACAEIFREIYAKHTED